MTIGHHSLAHNHESVLTQTALSRQLYLLEWKDACVVHTGCIRFSGSSDSLTKNRMLLQLLQHHLRVAQFTLSSCQPSDLVSPEEVVKTFGEEMMCFILLACLA